MLLFNFPKERRGVYNITKFLFYKKNNISQFYILKKKVFRVSKENIPHALVQNLDSALIGNKKPIYM